jgi:hypothetical protein
MLGNIYVICFGYYLYSFNYYYIYKYFFRSSVLSNTDFWAITEFQIFFWFTTKNKFQTNFFDFGAVAVHPWNPLSVKNSSKISLIMSRDIFALYIE